MTPAGSPTGSPTGVPPGISTGSRPGVASVLLAACSFLVAGALGAAIWRMVVKLPIYVRTADNAQMDAVELSKSVGIDGWYVVIGATLALALGLGLMTWLARTPRLGVLVIALGALAGGWLMVRVGELLGPGPVEARLAAAKVGEHVAVQLVPNTSAIFLVWPLAALLAALLVLLFGRPPADSGIPL